MATLSLRRELKAALRVLTSFFVFAVCAGATAEEWISIGPFGTQLINNDVIAGQVNALAVDPRDAAVLYVGASEGGVWKTSDGGGSWAPLADTQLVRKLSSGKSKGTLSIGSIAVNPANPQVVYVGTGEPNLACCFAGPGLGVFRSMDGGGSWLPLGTNLTQTACQNAAMSQAIVNRILVIPGRPTVVFAATNMGLFSYRESGSDCWTQLTIGLPFGNAIDLVADPFQGALYVAFWGLGIFKLTDPASGQWQMLSGGLPTSGFSRIALAFGGRSGLGFSPPLPLLYAGFNAAGQYRLFTTRDGGTAWTELPSPPSDGQLDFNNTIAVGLYSSDEVYVGQIALWRTLDGGRKGGKNNYKPTPPVEGNSWTNLSCCLADANPFRKNLDLHGDLHDIVLAPYGSFLPTPSEVEIVYVASDGGVTKGSVDFEGAVSWVPLTKGLAIGQTGTIGLDPGFQGVTVGGYWHNGDILSLTQPPLLESLPIFGGDGFQTSIDAGNLIVYFNCNAGFGGAICRALPPAPFNTSFKIETIWSDNTAKKHWSDPHRPGHLLRLQKNGLLFRTTVANTASPAVLNSADAWEAVDPFFGKTGLTTTMAFRSRVLEERPIYYVGTDSGQVWRGSPEAGWAKLCECGAAINAIAPDLFQNERIFVALQGPSSPGRIKELRRQPNGTWAARNIDAAFSPDLDVQAVTSIVVDPAVTGTRGTTVYVGTDQGVYRGHVDPLVLDPSLAAFALLPPVFGDWAWQRSPGVPNVWVTDLEAHQNFQGRDRSGVVRAGTYGRGIFELTRISGPLEKPPLVLNVQALQLNDDGAPSYLNVPIPVQIRDQKLRRDTPFELAPLKGTDVSLEAPKEFRKSDRVLKFAGWVIPGRPPVTGTKITLRLDEAVRAVAYYEKDKRIPDPKALPLLIAVSARAQQTCLQGFTHSVTLSWDVTNGQRPVSLSAEMTYPDKTLNQIELKHFEGSQEFPISSSQGGKVRIKVTATDSTEARSSAETNVELKPCR